MKEQEINFGQNPEQFKTLVGNHEICNVMGDGLYLKIREGIAELQGLELEEVTDEAVFTEPREKGGLGADSLARVEIVMKIEDILMEDYKEEFEKGIPDDQAEVVGRVSHIRDLFNVRMAARQKPEILPLWLEMRQKEIADYKAQKSLK